MRLLIIERYLKSGPMMPKHAPTWQVLWLNPSGEIARARLEGRLFLICAIRGLCEVSVIIPCLNERETIEQIIRAVARPRFKISNRYRRRRNRAAFHGVISSTFQLLNPSNAVNPVQFFLPWLTYEDRSHIHCAYQPGDLDER